METGGPAFPVILTSRTEEHTPGMSLLDYFAGQALAGFKIEELAVDAGYLAGVAQQCYETANKMLAERNKK